MVGVFFRASAARPSPARGRCCCSSAPALVVLPGGEGEAFGGAFIVDGFARFMKVLVLIGSARALAACRGLPRRRRRSTSSSIPVLIVLATLGMMLMISANDLIALYLGLELQSLALYVVAAINRDNARSTEAGLKYFVLGALSSGMLLYGASLVYGFTGTTSISTASPRRSSEAGRLARACLRPGVRARRPGLQDLGRAVPHVDARRL
jgi:NADH-quinone oxidoreductase subunit N